MDDVFERNVATLDDRKAAWVLRRDAAEYLGDLAARAMRTLSAHLADPDPDVRMAVAKALERAGTPVSARRTAYSLEQLAMACAKANEWEVTPHETGFAVTVKLPNGRRQTVYFRVLEPQKGEKVIRLYTPCGKPIPDSLRWALKANLKLAHGALALAGEGDDTRFVLTESIPMDGATPESVKRAVKGLAFYGDWMEQKLSGLDEL